jgi:hypothetical protein
LVYVNSFFDRVVAQSLAFWRAVVSLPLKRAPAPSNSAIWQIAPTNRSPSGQRSENFIIGCEWQAWKIS